MPNPLQMGAPPPPPEQAGGPANGLQINSPPTIGTAMPAAAPAAVPQQSPAPPSHEQTVAALRHFDAIKGGLTELLKDPATGRSDVKDKIIDGMAKLVAERMVAAPQAVSQLSQVPSDPVAQRKWLQGMLQQTLQAENGVLDHYGAGNPYLGSVADHMAAHKPSSRDDHMGHMKALHANYSSKTVH